MHMNKKIKHPHNMWLSQLHAYIYSQNQSTISNINHMHYNDFNQHSQLTQKTLTNLTNTQTKPLTNSNSQSEILYIQPIIFSHSHNKQTLNT